MAIWSARVESRGLSSAVVRSAACWCALLVLGVSAQAELVVYSVVTASHGDRAGITDGDVLVSWLRPATDKVASSAQGALSHALELRLVEIEQANIAPVTLEIDRGGERHFVELGSAVWQVKARPILRGDELEAWKRGHATRTQDPESTRAAWEPLIERWRLESGRRADAVWLGLEMAIVYQNAGDLHSAEEMYRAILDAVPADDRRMRALVSESFAAFYADRAGRPEQAMARAQEALALWQEVDPEGLGTLYTLRLISFLEMELGDMAAARSSMRRQLAILDARAGPTAEEGTVHHNLGYLHWLERDLVAAETEFRRAAAVVDELGLGPQYRRSRHVMLGVVSAQRGDLEAAEFHHRELVRIDELMDADPASKASAYGNLGGTLVRAGKLDEAEAAFAHSLDIRRRIQPDTLPLAMTLQSIAHVQRRKGNLDTAMASLHEARRIARAVAPGARVNGDIAAGIGRVMLERGEVEAARREFETALDIRRAVDPFSAHRANVAFVLHELAVRRGAVETAVGYCREAIETLDRYRASLGGTIEQQSRYGASIADRYHACAALLFDTGDAVASFELHERGRARIQRSLLAERDLRYDDADPAVLERLKKAQLRYEAALTDLRRTSKEEASDVDARFAEAESAYGSLEQVLAELRQVARRQAALSEPAPLRLAEVRAALPSGTLALSFSLGARDTLIYAFGPEPGAFAVYRVDLTRKQVEDQVDQVSELLSRPTTLGRARLERAIDSVGDRLLGGLGGLVQRAERLLVVPDDALYRLPFQLLRSAPDQPRLVESTPVSITPSLSLALALAGRPAAEPKAMRLAVIADPDLPAGEGREQTRRLLDLASPLERLPATAQEAERIRALAPERVRVFTGPEATESRVRQEAGTVDVLHFATHALADNRSPMESALVLSESAEDDAVAGAGLLQAWEIVETFDDVAPLVTLSACETGRGGEFRNEGLLGLVSALWFAGAEQVVASLWQVADESTADLMAVFYRHLLQGVPADEALRRAQLAVWKGEDDLAGRDHPFYWASFQVYGALAPP